MAGRVPVDEPVPGALHHTEVTGRDGRPTPSHTVQPLPTSPYLLMLFGSLAFAAMAALTHAAGQRCDWQVVAFFRSFLVFVFVGIYARSRGTKLVLWRPAILWMRSGAGSLSLVCTFYALTRLHPGSVLTLTNMFPIWVALLAWPVLGEWPSGRVWLAVLSAAAGVALVQQPELSGNTLALWVAFGASLATAVAMLGLHHLQDVAPGAVVVHFSAVSMAFCVAAFFVFPHSPSASLAIDSAALPLLLGVGLTASVGQLLLTRAFAAGEPAKVSVVGLSQVVFALALDVAWFGQPINGLSLLGTALILGPTAWVMLRRG